MNSFSFSLQHGKKKFGLMEVCIFVAHELSLVGISNFEVQVNKIIFE